MPRPATQAKPAPRRPAPPARAWPHLPGWLIAGLLLLVTIAIYWPATRGDFVSYDDDLHVTANVHVQKGLTWESFKWALLNPVNCIWHPVTTLSHMADCQLFGLNPWGHHLTSVLLHAVNTMLVFLLLWALTGARWRSVLAAALFGWHPLHVESVAWVAERKDVLSGLFGLLALMAYARYAQGRMQNAECRMQKPGTPAGETRFTFHVSRFTPPPATCYILSLVFLALGLMSKPMLLTWPFVMLLLDYWPLGRLDVSTLHALRATLSRLVREKIPFFVLVALGGVVAFVVQQRSGAFEAGENLPLGARLGNALVSYVRYWGKLFWPADLAVVYPHPGQWPLAKVLLAGALIFGISALFWARRQRYPCLLMGWLWYCGTLVPVIQIVQTGSHAMADRYTYLPALGGLILATWGAYELTRGWRFQRLALRVAGGVTIFMCLALARQQLGYWRDSEALFRHALAVTENNDDAHNGLGIALDQKGQMEEAIHQFREAIRLKPRYASAYCNLGIALNKNGQVDEAIRQFQQAILLKPNQAGAHYGLGIVLSRKGQMDEAIRELREAIRLKPGYAEAYNELGIALSRNGQLEDAIPKFQEAARLRADYAEADFNLGLALGMKGRTDEAIRAFEAALRAKPAYPEAHNYLGSAFYKQGRIAEAIREFQAALRLKPDYAEAQRNLDTARANQTLPARPQ
jgi:protein O-mannosyl-transferase